MAGDKENTIYKLCKKFALRIIRLCVFLRDSQHEQIMSRQIYRSGTSIGANVAESVFAQSEADYINKLKIALKRPARHATGLSFYTKPVSSPPRLTNHC